MEPFRVYGCSLGNGSLAVVTRGIVSALQELGLFAGLVPIDAIDPEDAYPGFDAPNALLVGPPTQATAMLSMGQHKERYLMLAPNSTWLPAEVIRVVLDSVTGFLTPSAWARSVLLEHLKQHPKGNVPVYVWPHGVSRAFRASEEKYNERVAAYDGGQRFARCGDGQFRVVHLTSTAFERKGTGLLLQAWGELIETGVLPGQARLCVVSESPTIAHTYSTIPNVVWTPRLNLGEAAMCEQVYWPAHLVAQPSRGEGFGMVPLEARASGVPVVITTKTGHSEYVIGDAVWSTENAVWASKNDPSRSGLETWSSGAFGVWTTEDAPIDDGPGALAPGLRCGDIADALRRAFVQWRDLAQGAQVTAHVMGERWNWTRVTRRALDSMNESKK